MPELFDVRLKARSAAFLFAAGAVVGALTLLLPHDARVHELTLAVISVIAVAAAALLYFRAGGMAEWELHAAVVVGIALVTVANHAVGPNALYALLYSWAALYAFYFFTLRVALVYLGVIAVAYGVLLAIESPMSPVIRWILAVGTPGVVGLLVSRVLGVLRAQTRSAEDHARALEQSEARTRMLLESAPDAFVSIDPDGTIVAWNKAAERLFGWSAAETLGRPIRELLFPPEGMAEHDERRRKLFADEADVAVMELELELMRSDGSRFPAEETLTRVRSGEVMVLSAFIRDTTDRRRREEERVTLLREQAAREEAERVAEMISGTQQLVDAALSHRTLDEILADLLPRVREVHHAASATFFLADEDGETLSIRGSAGGLPMSPDERVVVPLGQSFAGRVAAEQHPMLVHDPPPADLWDPSVRDLDIASVIGVPLLAGGEVRGVLKVASTDRRFNEEDLTVLMLAADRVALALDHVQVYEREHQIAETLQRSLLPERLPRLPGLAVAARYEPAATEADVGGDWYDVIPIPGGAVGLVMGDVAGKGLAAASMVGRLRSALRAYALEGHDPATVVENLNRLVWTELEESQMATLIYVCVDPAEGTVHWVSAGHPPPLLVVGDRMPHFLEAGRAVPLGVLPFPSYETLSVKLEAGATILLYTDGLVERPGTHIDEGLGVLAAAVRDAPERPEDLCDHLLREMVPPTGAPDDVAMLVLQNTPMADQFSVELPTQPEALASMRSMLRRWLRHAQGSDQEIAEITTACGEAATNAIEHAGASGGAPFELDGRLKGRQVDIVVRDYGAWREPRDGDQGRGISLMRALMDSVEVEPGADGTIVRLRRQLNGEVEK
jgi:PAS domain S-box-containing protein